MGLKVKCLENGSNDGQGINICASGKNEFKVFQNISFVQVLNGFSKTKCIRRAVPQILFPFNNEGFPL